jgi:hypothetical protein
MNKWKPFRGQVSLLASPGPFGGGDAPSVADLFEFIWSQRPQSFQQLPNNPLAPAVAAATLDNFALTCSILPNRVDVSIGPAIQGPAVSPPELRLIEDWSQFWAHMRQVIDKLAQENVPVPAKFDRVAVVAQQLSVAQSYSDANGALSAVIPSAYRIPLSDEEGFALQFGRPHDVPSIPGLTVGLVNKWSTEQLQVVQFAIAQAMQNDGQIAPAQFVPQIVRYTCASVTVEANTGASEQALPAGARVAALKKAVELVNGALGQGA